MKRFDAWFEIHALNDPSMSRDYLTWMSELKCPLYLIEANERFQTGVVYPRDEMLAKYGRYFFTSSLSWMFALALEQPGIEEIGLWGVDMAATEEYGSQRPGCHFFIHQALQRGIKITTPPEADLVRPPPLYGYTQALNHMAKKLAVRRRELEDRLAVATTNYENLRNEIMFLKGAIDDLNYIQHTWVD